ncbi:hypothetical protein D1872_298590 [compost metagenome]
MKYTNLPQSVADQNMLIFNTPSDFQHLTELLRDQMQTYTDLLRTKPAFLRGDTSKAYNVRQIQGSNWSLAEYRRAELDRDNPQYIWGRAFEITLNPTVVLH